ncbi:MAG: hypothetical protein UHP27_09050, partial [Muribaculaceae bacterium]|nr:hypothetical protein [Muribaculaceae bacterium]
SQTVPQAPRAGTSRMHLRFSFRKFNTFSKIHAPHSLLEPFFGILDEGQTVLALVACLSGGKVLTLSTEERLPP